MSLRDAIRQDTFIIDDNEYSDNDFLSMPTDDLETLKLRINNNISFISKTIKAKKIEAYSGGEKVTAEWYIRHKGALAINQQVLTYINTLIKQRRKAKRPLSDFFLNQAKADLDPKLFDSLMSKAKKEMNREGVYENC